MDAIVSGIMKAEGPQVCAADLHEALGRVKADDGVAAFFEAYSADPHAPLDGPQSHVAWNFYGDLCRAYWRLRNRDWAEDSFFSKELFFEGNFAEDLTEEFAAEAARSEIIPVRVEDSAPGYYFNAGVGADLVEQYSRIFIFRSLSPAAMNILHASVERVKPIITGCLGSAWRVVQTRYWEAKAGGEGIGTNSWHTDGFPRDALKILSFFSDVDEAKGTTQFKKLDGTIRVFRGRAGKWLLFRNSDLLHSGLPPAPGNGNRLTVEITLAPSLAVDSHPVFAGVNGHYPYVPWHRCPPRSQTNAETVARYA